MLSLDVNLLFRAMPPLPFFPQSDSLFKLFFLLLNPLILFRPRLLKRFPLLRMSIIKLRIPIIHIFAILQTAKLVAAFVQGQKELLWSIDRYIQ